MKRKISLIAMLMALGGAAGWAGDNPVVGTWDFTSVDDAGQSSTWTMVVKKANGSLTGTLSGDPGEFTLVDPKLVGKTCTFKVVINEVSYSVEATIDGNKLEGKYKGADSNGTLKGTKQS